MTIELQVLGAPDSDNAVLVRIDTGQAVHRLLCDCGEGCLDELRESEVQAVDHLLFSHFHMDHIAGFDRFFRANFRRETGPVQVWGPPGSIEVLHHRFRGFAWNLHAGLPGEWIVHEVGDDFIRAARFLTAEAFETAHELGARPASRAVVETDAYRIETVAVDHGIPCLAWVVREEPRSNVDVARLAELGIPPGPWVRTIKESGAGSSGTLRIPGRDHDLADLRRCVLVETPGDSVAYLTDLRLDPTNEERLLEAIGGCGTIVCESQYRSADRELARVNWHLTATDAARIASRAGARRLILFHVSQRYRPEERSAMLAEAREIFTAAEFPAHWGPA